MDIASYIVFFLAGLALIVKGGDLFVDASLNFSKKTKIPTIIVGATIVSVATSLPEFIISIIASVKGSFGLAVGNSVGSIIFNSALICGLSALLLPTRISKKSSVVKYLLLIFSCLVLFVFGLNNNISQTESIVLVLIGLLFFILSILNIKKEPSSKENNTNTPSIFKILVCFVLGASFIGFGAYLLVEYITKLATSFNIPEDVIAVTIIAVGTSLPELITTISSIKKKNAQLGIGNIIGTNIINIAFLIGISGLISGTSGLPITDLTLKISIPMIILSSLILSLPIILKSKTYHWQGLLLLSLYIAYFALVVFLTLAKVNI